MAELSKTYNKVPECPKPPKSAKKTIGRSVQKLLKAGASHRTAVDKTISKSRATAKASRRSGGRRK